MIRILLVCAFLMASIAMGATPSIVTIRTPNQGRVPEVVLDQRGVLHLAYGKDQDGYYVQSRDGGKTFSAPIKINQRAGTITVGAERGVKIAIGKDGVIHVVWLGHYQKGGGIWYTRSTDGGKTFAAERNVQDTNIGCDSPAIVADSSGVLLVFWLDGRLPKDAENPVSDAIILARSTDNGANFPRNEVVKYDFAGRACACCRIEARLSGEDVYLSKLQLFVAANKQAIITLTGRASHAYEIQTSADLITWTVLSTVTTGAGGSVNYTNTNAGSFSKRFYRTRDPQP